MLFPVEWGTVIFRVKIFFSFLSLGVYVHLTFSFEDHRGEVDTAPLEGMRLRL